MKISRGITRLVLCVCLLIVAAFYVRLEAAVTFIEDVPVPGGAEALAGSLAIEPAPEASRFISEVTRLVYEGGEVRSPAVAAFIQTIRQSVRNKIPLTAIRVGTGKPDLVPVPLTTDVWADAIFHRRLSRDELVLAIVADRQAAWFCHGLTRLDDETLEFFVSHPALLTRIYERSAGAFAAFSASVHVRENRVVPAGGPDAVALWEAIIGEKTTRPDRFLADLFDTNEGRLAYLYDTIGQLDPPRRAFALGLWMPNGSVRLERFKNLANAGANDVREWHVRVLPFNRASYDLGMTLMRADVDASGAPSPPSARGLWARVFGFGDPSDESPIDAAWLAANIVSTDVRQRGERLDQFTFGQRLFGSSTADRAEIVFVLRALPRFRAPLLAFERVGISDVATYAAFVRSAVKLTGVEGRRGYVAQAQLQGALALLTRMIAVGTFDGPAAERLLQSLAAVSFENGGYAGGIARWTRERLLPALPGARDVESAIVAGLSGRSDITDESRRVTWEGQQYRLDLAAAERNRLQRVREKQAAPPIDVPLQIADAAHVMLSDKVTIDDLQDIVTQFGAIVTDLPERSREEEADNVPLGVSPPPSTHEHLRKAVEEIGKAIKSKDIKRVPRIAEPVVEIADDLLARNLLSFAYAISLGDPEGTVLLADDVSHRHDFGYGLKDGEMRARITWAVPRQEVAPGVSWHVSGSLLGLDVGLATLALRRVSTDHVLEAPKLTTNARDTFATSVSLLDPLALSDADRDAIADGLERGQRRVAQVVDARQVDALATDLAIEPSRRRALQWTAAHDPARIMSLLSATELLTLGGAPMAALNAWGMAVIPANGCFCSKLMPPGAWPALAGRPQLGLATSVLPDLNFRVAVVLKELGLPAALAKVVLSAAMQDFIDEARPTDDSDWLSLARIARTVTRERIEDYVAAATATGPLMPDVRRSPEPDQ